MKKSQKGKKNPYLAAIANFLLPGVGYVYAGKKREFFSYGLSIATILSFYDYYFNPYEITLLSYAVGVLALIIFAYDAYLDASE